MANPVRATWTVRSSWTAPARSLDCIAQLAFTHDENVSSRARRMHEEVRRASTAAAIDPTPSNRVSTTTAASKDSRALRPTSIGPNTRLPVSSA